MDNYDLYADNIFTFVALSDLNQPYSCTQWANLAPSGSGDIVSDIGYGMFNLYNTSSGFPSFLFIYGLNIIIGSHSGICIVISRIRRPT